MTAYFPICLNLKDKRCLVIGGGLVALRKVKVLREYQLDISIVSPEIIPELMSLVDNMKIGFIQRTFRRGDLDRCGLAIAATDNRDVNLMVADEARKVRVPVNVVDDAESSDFIFPSNLRRGEITIAISTSGLSPALARKLRSRMEENFGDEYGELVRLVGDVRLEAKEAGVKIEAKLWQEALDIDSLIDLLRRGESEHAKNVLRDRLKIQKNK